MKIAFDEHVPVQMVRVFQSLGGEKRFQGFEFVSAKDYAPKLTDPDFVKKSDVPWLERFAQDGGKVIISGDVRMMDRPLEIQALHQRGFQVFFFERKWNRWDFYQKSALVLFYWHRIVSKIKKAKAGTFWRIPNHFRDDDNLRKIPVGKKQIKKVGPRASGGKVQAGSKGNGDKLDGRGVQHSRPKGRKVTSKPSDPNQPTLNLWGHGSKPRG